jgi:hypothetical protein
LTLMLEKSQPPSEMLRASLGAVGIASLPAPPNQEVSRPVRNEDVGRAAARGAGQAVRGVLSAPLNEPATNGLFLWVILLPVLVPGGAIVGAGVGAARESAENAANTIPEAVVQDMESLLRQVLGQHELQVELRRLVQARAIARSAGPLEIELRESFDRTLTADYTSLTEKGLRTVLEVGVSTVGLVGRGGTDPELTLLLDAGVRLINVSDNRVLWAQDHTVYTSAPHRLSTWSANGGKLVRSALNAGLTTLARQIDDRVFLEVWSN